jgi:hypothetical protein
MALQLDLLLYHRSIVYLICLYCYINVNENVNRTKRSYESGGLLDCLFLSDYMYAVICNIDCSSK